MSDVRPLMNWRARSAFRVAGAFAAAGMALVVGISPAAACSNPDHWIADSAVPGVDGTVYVTTMWDSDPEGPGGSVLLAGGNFRAAGNVFTRNIAAWDPSSETWSSLGLGLPATVRDIEALPNGDLVAAGFNSSSGRTVFRWDGASWTALGSISTEVRALAVLPGGTLVAAGAPLSGGGTSCVFVWNGTSWATLGEGIGGSANAMAVTSDGRLVVGGQLTNFLSSSLPANNIAIWNGTSWSSPGGGVGGEVFSILALPGGDFVAGGSFLTAGGNTARRIVRWNGTSWLTFGAGLTRDVYSLAQLPGGEILTTSVVSPGSLRAWNGTAWVNHTLPITSTRIQTLTVDDDGTVFTGGDISSAESTAVSGVTAWNGTSWEVLGDTIDAYAGDVFDLLSMPDGDWLVCGSMTSINGVPVDRLARFDATTGWSDVGPGFDGAVHVMEHLPSGDILVGGAFTSIGSTTVRRLARWDGVNWSEFGGGASGPINSIEVQTDGSILVGGGFTEIGGVTARNAAKWDGATWLPFGAGPSNPIGTIAMTAEGVAVVTVGNLPQLHPQVYVFNGAAWTERSVPPNSSANDILSIPGQDTLVAGGFVDEDIIAISCVRRWNGVTWVTLDSPAPNGDAMDLEVDANGNVAIGGRFSLQTPNGYIRNVASWNGQGWQGLGAGVGGSTDLVTAMVSTPTGEIGAILSYLTPDGRRVPRLVRYQLQSECAADHDGNFVITVNDLFAFLASYFAGDLSADFNQTGDLSVQDIFDFLAAFFEGC